MRGTWALAGLVRAGLVRAGLVVFALVASSLGCAAGSGGEGRRVGPVGSGDGTGQGASGASGTVPGSGNVVGDNTGAGVIVSGVCGNGSVTPDEACDDGDTVDGDGCSADCLAVERGYACQRGGMPCRKIARCGDGVVAVSEACDDGNSVDGDGCSTRCRVEVGWKCDGDPSSCSATTCGDGMREGVEGCDDGNAMPFDGCSAICQTEPSCAGGAACTSECGDGLVLNEACDDGNAKSGDGCSADCAVEDGFTCTTETSCELRDGRCILRVPALFRDFTEAHSDFAIGCGQLTTGLVQAMLNGEGKPVLASPGACIASAQSFAEWYTSGAHTATVVGELTLYENGAGGFVNRFGPNGEQFEGPPVYSNIVYGGPGGTGCGMCTPSAQGQCFDPCTPWGAGNTQACCADFTQTLYDGNPLFFPIDQAPNALTGTRYRAKIPEQYGYNGWPWEDMIFPGAGSHNFHFTTEVVYWFKYEASTRAVLDFTGDDDVWVFVNGRLAVDLGGPHVPMNGSVTIDASSAPRFGLQAGSVYEVRVFHAERKVEGSSFKLTLSGFNVSPSDCTPVCGDGNVVAGEECDDGVNDGSYEGCAPGCVLGPRCGDGIIQEGEDCDDGNRRDGDGCGSVCRHLRVD